MPRDLFVDLTNQRLAASTGSLAPSATQEFVAGDEQTIRLFFVQPTGSVVSPFSVANKASASVKFGIGNPTAIPVDGSFNLTFGGSVASLNYSATAGAVSTALNAMTAMQAAGGCAVTGGVGQSYIVRFNSNSAQSTITATATDLIPATTATTTKRVAGGSQQEVQEIVFKVAPAVFQDTWAAVTGAVTCRTAVVDFSNANLRDLIGSQNKATARLEIQLTEADGTSTVVATECVCKNQLLV